MSLLAISTGPGGTIQDRGRFGYRRFGVPVSGSFDCRSALVANALLGNAPGTAILELSGSGGVYEAESDLAIAIAGAEMLATVTHREGTSRQLTIRSARSLRSGDRLELRSQKTMHGFRTYLAVRGGWRHCERLGSLCDERPISTGVKLSAMTSATSSFRTDLGRLAPSDDPIRYLAGPDAALLDDRPFLLKPDSNRIGLRFESDPIEIDPKTDRKSTPVTPGTMQVAGGQLIILGPACGTMGGYPEVGQVLSADLDRLGQLRPGSIIRLCRVELFDARAIDCDYRATLESLWLRLSVASGAIT